MESKRLYTTEEVAAIIGLTVQSTRKIINEDGVYVRKIPVRDKKTGELCKEPRLGPDGEPLLDENGTPVMRTVCKIERKKGIRATKAGRSYLVTSEAIRDYLGGDFEEPTKERERAVQEKKLRQRYLPDAKRQARQELEAQGIDDPEAMRRRTEEVVSGMVRGAAQALPKAREESQTADDGTVKIPAEMGQDLIRILKAVRNGKGATSAANRVDAQKILDVLGY